MRHGEINIKTHLAGNGLRNEDSGGHWNVSNVTDMSYMFYGATHFDRDIDQWEVNSAADMTCMFEGG